MAAAGDRPLTQALRKLGRARRADQPANRYYELADALWEQALDKANKNALLAMRLILEYCEGRPRPLALPEREPGRALKVTGPDVIEAIRQLALFEAGGVDGSPVPKAGG